MDVCVPSESRLIEQGRSEVEYLRDCLVSLVITSELSFARGFVSLGYSKRGHLRGTHARNWGGGRNRALEHRMDKHPMRSPQGPWDPGHIP